MEFTPVRVRGARPSRKRQAGDWQSWPVKSRKQIVASNKSRSAGQNTLLNTIDGRRLSNLESLPNELMQTIFAFTSDLNLPLSSPLIALQLSDRRTTFQFAVDTVYCPERNGSGRCSGHDRARVSTEALLNRRFMTWKFFKEVVVEASLRAQRDRVPLEQERQSVADPNRESDAELSNTLPEIPAADFQRPSLQRHLDYLHLDSSVSMPKQVLDGPWSADKAQFLHYLAWLGLGIDWDHSTLGETASSGLVGAIASGKTLAVATLLSPPIGVPPSQRLLRTAILEHGCDRTVVFHLVSAAVRSYILSRTKSPSSLSSDINFRDPSLWSWASRVKTDKGRWLKDLLKMAADLVSLRSQYDQDVYEEMVLSCGREVDGVEQISVVPYKN